MRPSTLWNVGTRGFGRYRYRYDSGREGDSHTIGFYARRGKITVYLMDGTVRYSELLVRLGWHTTSRVCLYFKRLSDVDLLVLEQIVQESYNYISSHSMARCTGRRCRAALGCRQWYLLESSFNNVRHPPHEMGHGRPRLTGVP